MTNIIIIGAGKGGASLIELLVKQRDVRIVGVVVRDGDASLVELAKKYGVPSSGNIVEFLKEKPDIIINEAGSRDIEEELRQNIAPGTEIIGGGSAKLMFDLVNEARTAEEQVHFQSSIIARVRNAVVVTDLDGRVQQWNRYAEDMFHWEAAEAAGKPFFTMILPYNRQSDAEELLGATLFEGYWEGEIVAQKKDGSLFSAFMNNSVLRDDLARPIAIISISSDITELKRAEESFKTEAGFRKAVEDAVRPGIVAYDTDGRQLYVNQGFCKLVGWSEEELVGIRPPFPYWPPEESDYNASVFEAMLNEQTGSRRTEMVLRRCSGEVFHALVLTTPFHDEYGKVKGWVSSISDITEYKQKEWKLSDCSNRLRNLYSHLDLEMEAERKDIASRVHDEIGQPFAALKLELSSLSRKLELEEERKDLIERTSVMSDIIDKSIQSVKTLCNGLRPWILDDMGIVEAVKWKAQEFSLYTGIKHKIVIDPPEFFLDRSLSTTLFRIFQEVLSNVDRHAKATDIYVSFVKKPDRIVLEVRDNGIGIAEELISDEKSFGLIGIRERALVWGGEVEIKGAPGEGTTVTVHIPLPGY